MGTYCFDQYDHPLLWCKEKKKLIERKNAEESIKLWNIKKNEELTRIIKDKEEYNEMFIKYCPWGRPGGGAPNLNIRMHNITTEGLHPVAKCTMKSPKLPPCSVQIPCGKIAQIRSAIDRVYITLKDRPSVSKSNTGQFDIELRYKSSPRNKKVQLEKVVVKNSATPKQKSREKKLGKEHTTKVISKSSVTTQRRAPTAAGTSFMRSLGCTNKELLKELDQEAPLNLTDKKKTTNSKRPPSKIEAKRCCALCTCKCPAILVRTESPQLTKSKKSPKKKRSSNYIEKSDIGNHYSNNDGICPRAIRDMNTDYISNKECKPKEIHENKKLTKTRDYMISNKKSELVPLLTKRRGLIHRPVSLCTTDVTRHVDQNRFTHYGVEYMNELDRQIKQKRRRYKLNKEEELELCNEHFKTFNTFWGRPGHGAPKSIKTKLNLDDLLYCIPVGLDC